MARRIQLGVKRRVLPARFFRSRANLFPSPAQIIVDGFAVREIERKSAENFL
jgi:hypothetical protein